MADQIIGDVVPIKPWAGVGVKPAAWSIMNGMISILISMHAYAAALSFQSKKQIRFQGLEKWKWKVWTRG